MRSRLSTTTRTADLFQRPRRDRPETTDPTQRFPTSPEVPQRLVGTRCAASLESFVPARLLTQRFPPFHPRPSLTRVHHPSAKAAPRRMRVPEYPVPPGLLSGVGSKGVLTPLRTHEPDASGVGHQREGFFCPRWVQFSSGFRITGLNDPILILVILRALGGMEGGLPSCASSCFQRGWEDLHGKPRWYSPVGVWDWYHGINPYI